jgi:hypothetical protein
MRCGGYRGAALRAFVNLRREVSGEANRGWSDFVSGRPRGLRGRQLAPDINKIAINVGCPSPTAYETNDSSIHKALACGDGRRIFTFNSNDDRDNFRKKFEQIGATFEEGNGYLVYAGDA